MLWGGQMECGRRDNSKHTRAVRYAAASLHDLTGGIIVAASCVLRPAYRQQPQHKRHVVNESAWMELSLKWGQENTCTR